MPWMPEAALSLWLRRFSEPDFMPFPVCDVKVALAYYSDKKEIGIRRQSLTRIPTNIWFLHRSRALPGVLISTTFHVEHPKVPPDDWRAPDR